MILYGPNGETIQIIEYRESAGFWPVLIPIEEQTVDPVDGISQQWIDIEEDDGGQVD